ncbi:MAG: ABC transporter ATP-binding protein [Gammaproteobacteria bacterium]|nr:ABC transporter ATP-binding protein [Gammaproteobacteria bacterium]
MLKLEHLQKSYGGRPSVADLSLGVAPGEVYALLGPNGAGKTTTIHCILGFVDPDGGRIQVGDVDALADREAARQLLAYIPEQVSLYESFSGLENLRYFSELCGRRLADAKLAELLERAGLPAADHTRWVAEYSKGMRQKVGIAVALARQARLLLLDEPTSGLDPSAANEFGRLLRELAAGGVAVLMATHDLFRARQDASRVGILRSGRLVRELEGPEIREQDLEAAYLRAIEESASSPA